VKRIFFVILAICIALGSVAAPRDLPPEVRAVIERALAREREAVARYGVFAAKAAQEGYAGAASLFRAQAASEATHAERFAALLRSRGLTVPAGEILAPAAGTTSENLRVAAAAERDERDRGYPEAVEACSRNEAPEIAKVFEQTRDSETEHGNLCSTAARDLDALKSPKDYYVCLKCGYTTDVKLPFCPACQLKEPPHHVE
jgi:rubrerythrin